MWHPGGAISSCFWTLYTGWAYRVYFGRSLRAGPEGVTSHVVTLSTRENRLSMTTERNVAKASRMRNWRFTPARRNCCGGSTIDAAKRVYFSFSRALARLLPRLFYPDRALVPRQFRRFVCRGNCRAANLGAAGDFPRQIEYWHGFLLSRPCSVIAAAILSRQGFRAAAVSAVFVPRQLPGR